MNSEMPFFCLQERDKFASELSQCQLPNRVAGDNLSDAVQLWREGLLTNWEYLMQLNKMAGRSYNDLMQYPVFPFVIADYTSQVLDLTDPQVYRYFCLLLIVTVLTLCHIMSDINHIVKILIDLSSLKWIQTSISYGISHLSLFWTWEAVFTLLPSSTVYMLY
jgi:hypothetical protein